MSKTDNKDLTAEEIKYSRLLAKGVPKTTAYRQAYPLQAKQSYDTIWRKSKELAKKEEITTEVQTTREKQAQLARLAETRIEEFLTEVKPNRTVADVAMFMYDHANGKATIKAEIKSAHVSVTYDLSGGQAGDVPPEVLAQLNQA
jgi:hypothetical protein